MAKQRKVPFAGRQFVTPNRALVNSRFTTTFLLFVTFFAAPRWIFAAPTEVFIAPIMFCLSTVFKSEINLTILAGGVALR